MCSRWSRAACRILVTSISVPNPIGWHIASTIYVTVQQHGRCRHARTVARADRHAEWQSRGLADSGCFQTRFWLLDLRHAGRIQPLGPVPGQRLDPWTASAGRIGYGAGVLCRLGERPMGLEPTANHLQRWRARQLQHPDHRLDIAQGQPSPGFA